MEDRATAAVHDAIRLATQGPSPEEGARGVLSSCVELAAAHTGAIHLLSLASGQYEQYVELGTPMLRAPRLHAPHAGDAFIGEVVTSHEVQVERGGEPSAPTSLCRIGVPILRTTTCLGVIDLMVAEPTAASRELRRDLRTLAKLVIPVYERKFVLRLLSWLQEPLDFAVTEHEFFDAATLLIAEASGMEFAALRERTDEGALRCIALWGFGVDTDKERFDFEVSEIDPPFARALDGETVAVRNLRKEPGLDHLRDRAEVEDVVSFVAAPVKVGTGTFGVLSVGSSCEYEYAEVERLGFESLANGVGVAITNFRNFASANTELSRTVHAGAAMLAVEVAQAARHEAYGRIEEAQANLIELDSIVTKHDPTLSDVILETSRELKAVTAAIQRIRDASRPPDREMKAVRLREVWSQAVSAITGRLNLLRIRCHYIGPDVTVLASPDWLRQVFLNLLINSADAFAESGQQRGRRIALTVGEPSARAQDVVMTYSDNATGINRGKLRLTPEAAAKPFEQQVFEPAVTSKEHGSGWGLFLARRILAFHKGSIDLVDWRNGVAFRISLPAMRNDRASDGS